MNENPARLPTLDNARIAIVGLGYVRLPLAVEFGKKFPVVGFDIKPQRITELDAGRDSTREVEPAELTAARHLSYTTDAERLRNCNVFIVTVPTPFDLSTNSNLQLSSGHRHCQISTSPQAGS